MSSVGRETSAENQQDNNLGRIKQSLKVVGLVNCKVEGCKELAAYYCLCGTCLCIIHMLGHKCLSLDRSNLDSQLKEAMR
jgi:hypothetical protein